tara:strand:+ start:1105 stop:1473 length:369 start_codon:yes stop_codon:yes gene_type:complete
MKPEQMSLLISVMGNVPDLATFRWTDNTSFSSAGVAFAYESANGNKLRGRINESGRGGYIENKEVHNPNEIRSAMETLSKEFKLPPGFAVKMIPNPLKLGDDVYSAKPRRMNGFMFSKDQLL